MTECAPEAGRGQELAPLCPLRPGETGQDQGSGARRPPRSLRCDDHRISSRGPPLRPTRIRTLEKGLGSTTLEFKISFVRPITPETGPIKAEGTVISRGRRVGTAEGRVTDGEGRLLVHGTTTCLIFEA